MDPPPYSELEGLNWNAIASRITTENISPPVYYSLQVLMREETEKFVGLSEISGGGTHSRWVDIRDLRRAYIYWKILHIFDDSEAL